MGYDQQTDALVLDTPVEQHVLPEPPLLVQALIQENKIAAIRQSHLVGDRRKGVQVRAYAGQAKDPGIVGVGQQVTRMGREAG